MPRYTSSSSCSRDSTSTSTMQGSQRTRLQEHSDNKEDVLKSSLVFLGAIGAASLAASKLWPKGILYGEKESWAQEAKKKVKHAMGEDEPNHRQDWRRTQSAGRAYADQRRQRPPITETEDGIMITRPGHRSMYVDTGRIRQYHEADNDRGRQRLRTSETAGDSAMRRGH
ncbi:uncharacterized protein F4812DRAFT_133514 [Daldinia caldariorum]|uniref:uncharacterized protein n=1 Tax=Daldinia caldariorum TaxID=326644 RepID=UPI002007BA7D|nr:uncharacterized protein F4812DRAFT_133514 [Daldinia caldariorum]KAI1465132.1 hypothetical protein F4812DRAFT_133514 [Daldinia caldariorum]